MKWHAMVGTLCECSAYVVMCLRGVNLVNLSTNSTFRRICHTVLERKSIITFLLSVEYALFAIEGLDVFAKAGG